MMRRHSCSPLPVVFAIVMAATVAVADAALIMVQQPVTSGTVSGEMLVLGELGASVQGPGFSFADSDLGTYTTSTFLPGTLVQGLSGQSSDSSFSLTYLGVPRPNSAFAGYQLQVAFDPFVAPSVPFGMGETVAVTVTGVLMGVIQEQFDGPLGDTTEIRFSAPFGGTLNFFGTPDGQATAGRFTANVVPEPGSLVLIATGAIALARFRGKHRLRRVHAPHEPS
jgi:hypothetical protein